MKIKIIVFNVTMPDGEKFKQFRLEELNGRSISAPTFSSISNARKWANDNGYILSSK